MKSKSALIAFATLASVATMVGAQQPPEPVDISPIDGEVYYLINQHSGLHADTVASDGWHRVTQQPWNFRSSSQRWMLARADDGRWAIESVGGESCLADEAQRVVLTDCRAAHRGRWELIPSGNGYYAVRNSDT